MDKFEITGSKVVDLRTRWQKFKDLFRKKKRLKFEAMNTIVHHDKDVLLPDGNKHD